MSGRGNPKGTGVSGRIRIESEAGAGVDDGMWDGKRKGKKKLTIWPSNTSWTCFSNSSAIVAMEVEC